MIDSTHGISFGGQYPSKKITITSCKAGISILWLVIIIICLCCFCCSVSSSFGAMYWKRSSLCKNTCEENVDTALEEITETFKNTTGCGYNGDKDIITDINAYRNGNQIY